VPNKRVYHFIRPGMAVRVVFIMCWAVIAAFGIATILVPPRHDPAIVRGIGIVMAVVPSFILIRSFRAATIDIYPDAVVVRGLVRTSKLSLSDVAAFATVPRVNLWGIPGNALALRLRNGRMKVFGEFWSSHKTHGFSVDKLVEELNREIRSQASASAGA